MVQGGLPRKAGPAQGAKGIAAATVGEAAPRYGRAQFVQDATWLGLDAESAFSRQELRRQRDRLMGEHHIHHIPVQQNGRVVGIVSERDLYHLGDRFLPIKDRARIRARDIMADDPYIVAFDTPLNEVALEMAKRHAGSAIVLQHLRSLDTAFRWNFIIHDNEAGPRAFYFFNDAITAGSAVYFITLPLQYNRTHKEDIRVVVEQVDGGFAHCRKYTDALRMVEGLMV